jgi:GTPase SAR1 family protein
VTGLIGFGGEGKSCLARRWLDALLEDKTKPQPDGIFWWGFYEKRNVDEFFEAALSFMF